MKNKPNKFDISIEESRLIELENDLYERQS